MLATTGTRDWFRSPRLFGFFEYRLTSMGDLVPFCQPSVATFLPGGSGPRGCVVRRRRPVTKVEPPNWWVRHTRNPIQVLLTGTELKDASVTGPKGFRIEVRRTADNGHTIRIFHDQSHDQSRKLSF